MFNHKNKNVTQTVGAPIVWLTFREQVSQDNDTLIKARVARIFNIVTYFKNFRNFLDPRRILCSLE